MNGVRTTFMRRGYLLTALSALLLLAASVGTASAQDPVEIAIKSVKVDAANDKGVVGEGVATAVTVTLSQKLPAGVTATVTVGVQGDDGTTGNAEGSGADLDLSGTTVNIATGNDTGSVALITRHDLDAVDEKFTIQASGLTLGGTATGFTASVDTMSTPATGYIDDDETQTYELKPVTAAENIKEGDTFDMSLSANPQRPANETVSIHIRSEAQGYTIQYDAAGTPTELPTAGLDLTSDDNLQTLHVSFTGGGGNDKNRTDDPLTLTGYIGTPDPASGIISYDEVARRTVTVLDIHQMPDEAGIMGEAKDKNDATGTVVTMIEEGGKAYLTVTVVNKTDDRVNDGEKFTLTPSIAPGDAADARITPASMMFDGAGSGSDGKVTVGTFTIEAVEDEDVGAETLMVSLNVAGDQENGAGNVSGMFEIDITDTTRKKIEPKATDADYEKIKAAIAAGAGDDEMLNPGETVTLMTSDLFTVMDGYTASYGAAANSDAVSVSASGGTITINAVKKGMADVTVTGSAKMASSSLQSSQTVSNIAEITFPVTVDDKMLTLMIDAPGAMEGNVVEGMDYDITVTTNRAVHDDTEVTFMRSDMSEADVRDYSIDPVTIMAGETMATATLMVTEDMADDAGHDMGEALHLYAMAGDTMSNTLELIIWDDAVPALPLIGQLLLALFLMAGGARLYRRRQG